MTDLLCICLLCIWGNNCSETTRDALRTSRDTHSSCRCCRSQLHQIIIFMAEQLEIRAVSYLRMNTTQANSPRNAINRLRMELTPTTFVDLQLKQVRLLERYGSTSKYRAQGDLQVFVERRRRRCSARWWFARAMSME